jgi:hypothetical protein
MDNHNEYLRKMMKKKFDEMNWYTYISIFITELVNHQLFFSTIKGSF